APRVLGAKLDFSDCFAKLFVAEGQAVPIRPLRLFFRKQQALTVDALDAMAQHWSVDFLQEIIPHHDLVIGCYSDEVPVIGGMVDFAERKAVVDHGLAAEITVGDNMGYIQ